MTRSEVGRLLAISQAVFPNIEVKNVVATSSAWHFLLGDIDYALAEKALKVVLSTQKIPAWPTPGAIRQAALDLCCRVESEDEVLNEIISAVHKYGHIGERQGLATLSPIAHRVSVALGWEYMCSSEEPGVLRGQIRGLYKSCVERVKQDTAMLRIGTGEKFKELTRRTINNLPKAGG